MSVVALPAGVRAQPTFEIHLLGTLHAAGASAPSGGLTPSQIRGAYGLDNITFQGVQGDGAGQTIAIVDAYDDPNALNDLNAFSTQFSLPQFNTSGGPTFQKLNENGGSSLPPTDPNGPYSSTNKGTWEIEESLDIEWAHVAAPMANIILFEAADADSGLMTAVRTAAATPGVVVVAMSWSENETAGENDSLFTTPSGHLGGAATMGGAELPGGITFLASAGDYGAYTSGSATITPQYPACSPNVVAVGGTSLYPAGNGYGSETAWGNGTSSWNTIANGGGGGGGGISSYEPQPSYQIGVVNAQNTSISTTNRTYPDVSADANPYTGVPIYDSYDYGDSTPWVSGTLGGTSLACPLWAGMIAVADQGRAIAGLGSLDGPSQTLPDLYKLPAADFHDILYDSATNSTAGNTLPGPTTGPSPLYSPGPGYDLATGLGSPAGNLLIPQLVTGPASMLAITQGPTSGLAGASLTPTITVDVDDASGNLVVTDDSSVTLSIGNNPSGGTLLGTRTAAAVNGVATFSGLSIETAGNGYTLIASDGGLATATSAAFNIAVNPAQPTVATPASATPNPVSGTTSSLSVLGADPTGEANLTYSWSALSLPSGASAPAFSPNQTNAAKNTTATFSSAGTYVFLVTITNASGLSKASTVSVTVSPMWTALAVTPGPVTLSTQSQQQFTATELDQFGNAMGTPPATTWSAGHPLAGGGTITPTGLYTAPAAAGSDTVTAQSGTLLATATVTIAAPVGWWKLNEGAGTTADDSSASGDNGTIVNGTWIQPPNGFNGAPALQFNGQSSENPSVVQLGGPAVLNFSGQITLSAWIKPASITQSQYILDHRANMANNLFLMINGNGTYQVGVESNGTFYGASASIPPQDLNAWVHLAGTYDGTTWRLYRDGQLVASSTASIGAISMSQAGIYKPTWGIGAATSFPVGGMRYFDGAIDDVRIYNTAISSSAISSLEAIPPTVAAPAAASPATVTGTTAALSVLGADAAGESTLTYAWAAAGTPPAPVTFSANGSHAAQNTTVTFTAAGTYNFLVTIANAAGLTVASDVSVTVNQTLTSIIVAGQPLAAMAYDQFGNPLANQPAYDSGSDTISAALALASNVTVVPAAGSQLTLSGGISGAGTLTVDTQGTVVLTGTNSYTGGTTVSAGKLILTSSSAIAANSSLMVGTNLSLFAPSFAASPSAVPAVATSAPNTVAAGTPSGLNDSPFAVPSAAQTDASPKGASATNADHAYMVPDRCPPTKGAALGTPSHTSRSATPTTQPFSLPKDGPPVGPARTSASSSKAAGDIAWLPQVANGSDSSDPNRKWDVAILALEAVFAQYGR